MTDSDALPEIVGLVIVLPSDWLSNLRLSIKVAACAGGATSAVSVPATTIAATTFARVDRINRRMVASFR
ncbi:MAG: hypothetical protein QM611_06765 [Microbacterium sp.]|uniref:hypothetical protein n=1 Tax=Microbacterium sp. TaxID=51671 RepID=UPI0039E35FBD